MGIWSLETWFKLLLYYLLAVEPRHLKALFAYL